MTDGKPTKGHRIGPHVDARADAMSNQGRCTTSLRPLCKVRELISTAGSPSNCGKVKGFMMVVLFICPNNARDSCCKKTA